MITIDTGRCTACGACVAICPTRNLRLEDSAAQWSQHRRCLDCLHCVAVCPTAAVGYDGAPAVAALVTGGVGAALETRLITRRSYRSFKKAPVERALISKALEIAKWAPSAKNEHPTKWAVLTGEKTVSEVMALILEYVRETGNAPEIASVYDQCGYNMVMGTAVTLLVGYADKTAINPVVDTALAIDYAELWLQENGVGTCWAGYLTRMVNAIPALSALLGISADEQAYGALMLGYPEGETYLRAPNRPFQAEINWVGGK